MGAQCTTLGKKEARLVVLGLDCAGKTTILYKLKLGEVVTTIPTIGFNVETLDYKKFSLTAWDVGGQDKIRALWRHYLSNNDALIYVVDSSDRERITEAKDQLDNLLSNEELKSTVVLVLANKQDLPNAMSIQEVTTSLGLNLLKNRKWFIQGTAATTGDGLYEGLDWVVQQLGSKK